MNETHQLTLARAEAEQQRHDALDSWSRVRRIRVTQRRAEALRDDARDLMSTALHIEGALEAGQPGSPRALHRATADYLALASTWRRVASSFRQAERLYDERRMRGISEEYAAVWDVRNDIADWWQQAS